MTQETDINLINAYRNGDLKSRDILAAKYAGFVIHVANQMAKTMHRSLDGDHLSSFAFEGLMRAFDKWEPDGGMSLMNFIKLKAVWAIKSGLKQESGIETISRNITNTKSFSQILACPDANRRDAFQDVLIASDDSVKAHQIEQVWSAVIKRSRSDYDKQLIYCYYRYGFTLLEIGNRLGFTESHISVQMRKAVDFVRLTVDCSHKRPLPSIRDVIPICMVAECQNAYDKDGLCATHLREFAKYGSLSAINKICHVLGCFNSSHQQGLCKGHHAKLVAYLKPVAAC